MVIQAIKNLVRELSNQEEAWSYRPVRQDFAGGEENYWFEQPEGKLRRSFSVWRFFKISDRRASIMWRVAVALGCGEIVEPYPFMTWSSPREFEIYSFRMDPQGLELSFIECESPEALKAAADRFLQYRRANHVEMLADCWRGLGSVIGDNEYLPKLKRLDREAQILRAAADGNVEVIAPLHRFVTAVDLGWAEMGVPLADEDRQAKDLCGIAALKFYYDRREIANTSDALVAYKLGCIWFDNRGLIAELESEIQGLIDSAQ